MKQKMLIPSLVYVLSLPFSLPSLPWPPVVEEKAYQTTYSYFKYDTVIFSDHKIIKKSRYCASNGAQ